jgi:hypothetical protein
MNGSMQRVFRFTLAGSWIGGTGECRGRQTLTHPRLSPTSTLREAQL